MNFVSSTVQPNGENPVMEFGIYSSIPASDPITDFVNSELSQKRLRFYLPENDLGKALTHLYRSSRTSIEENGANTLYLALGLLKWYETPSSERPRYAPILLLPVEIIRKSAAKGVCDSFAGRGNDDEHYLIGNASPKLRYLRAGTRSASG